MRSAERAGSILNDKVSLFSSVGKLQLPRDHSAKRHRLPPWPCLVPSLLPRPPVSPLPSLWVCVSDPEAVWGGGTVGGRRRGRRLHQHPSCAARSDLPRALRERTTKRAPRFSLRPRLLSTRFRGQLPSRGLAGWRGRRRRTLGCLLALLAYAHFTPSLRFSGPCWDWGHQQLSGECGRGAPREGWWRGRRGVRARRARNFLGGCLGRPAGSPRPPARPRAGGGRERSLRRGHPAPSQEEAPLSGAGPTRPPPPPGSPARGGQILAPRSARGRKLREGSSAEAGRKRELKEKQRGRWAFLLFVWIC